MAKKKKIKGIYLKSKEFKKNYEEVLKTGRPCEETLGAYVNFIMWLLDQVDAHNNGYRTNIIKGHFNEYRDDEYLELEEEL